MKDVIVGLKGGVDFADFLKKNALFSSPRSKLLFGNTFRVTANTDRESAGWVESWSKHKDVEFAQIDEDNELAWAPNDADFAANRQWNLSNINCPRAWDIARGKGIVVAVVDGGVDGNHAELNNRFWRDTNGNNGINLTTQGTLYDTSDFNGHGTIIAGIIAANANNSIGIAGMAPNAKIMVIKAFGPGTTGGKDSMIAQGIVYATDNGAHVINNSWASPTRRPSNPVVKQAIDYAHAKGAIIVCAAGNSNLDAQNFAPANLLNVLAVGAVDRNDNKIATSNYGWVLSVSAPGSTVPNPLRVLQSGPVVTRDYSSNDTSTAAAHVSALVALILSRNRQMKLGNIRYLIENFADPLATPLPMGRGRINAYNTLVNTPNNALKAWVTINRLKITKCDDDDEDMSIGLDVLATYKNGKSGIIFSRNIPEYYVELDGKTKGIWPFDYKIGEEHCVFFAGANVQSEIDIQTLTFDIILNSLDDPGLSWGGSHKFTLDLRGLSTGITEYTITKGQTDHPQTGGEFELKFTLVLFCQFFENAGACNSTFPDDF